MNGDSRSCVSFLFFSFLQQGNGTIFQLFLFLFLFSLGYVMEAVETHQQQHPNSSLSFSEFIFGQIKYSFLRC